MNFLVQCGIQYYYQVEIEYQVQCSFGGMFLVVGFGNDFVGDYEEYCFFCGGQFLGQEQCGEVDQLGVEYCEQWFDQI